MTLSSHSARAIAVRTAPPLPWSRSWRWNSQAIFPGGSAATDSRNAASTAGVSSREQSSTTMTCTRASSGDVASTFSRSRLVRTRYCPL